jgi:molybdopterin synthase catalytic subunit
VFRLTHEPLDLDELLGSVTLPTSGAACVFSGLVRAETRRGEMRNTEYLEYEAYEPMAREKMEQVAREIRDRWPRVEGVAIVQRLGHLDPGTPTVLIACTAAHRDEGVFEAARYGIDRLKQIVPIWKKEVGSGGEAWVEGDYRPAPADRQATKE